MSSLNSSPASQIRQLNQQVREALKSSSSFEEAAQTTVDILYATFPSSLALVRLYLTVPYQQLQKPIQQFVQALISTKAPDASLISQSQILTLFGTRGAQPEWDNRRSSNGHKGIPLLSSSFVSTIPMLAALLKELGADLTWLDTKKEFLGKSLGGNLASVFYVADAATTKDEHSRLVIPAQDFVATQKVKTVFGVGGSYVNGQILTMIFFCKEYLSKEQAEQFIVLANVIKAATVSLLSKQLFSH
jgi:hypothetical protein